MCVWVYLFVTSGYSLPRHTCEIHNTHTHTHIKAKLELKLKHPVYYVKHNGDFYVEV